jgi:hypothetical protein
LAEEKAYFSRHEAFRSAIAAGRPGLPLASNRKVWPSSPVTAGGSADAVDVQMPKYKKAGPHARRY